MGAKFPDIDTLRWRTQAILPLVYSDSLSYMEQVAKITQKTNEVIERVNALQSEILDEAKQYTDEQIAEALVVIHDAVEEVYSVKQTLQGDYSEFTRLTTQQLLLFNSKMDTINERIDSTIVSINARTDLAIQQNNEYLLRTLSQYLNQIKILNYFTGESVTVQQMFDFLALLHVEYALNYNELIAKHLTYTTLASRNVSYTDLVLHGRTLL